MQEEELIAVLDRARQLGLLTERAEDLLWNALDDSETRSSERRLLRAGAGAVEDVAPAPARTPARCCCCRDATQLKAGI